MSPSWSVALLVAGVLPATSPLAEAILPTSGEAARA
jgi:hypothetical protein